jgi:hypothetical protein
MRRWGAPWDNQEQRSVHQREVRAMQPPPCGSAHIRGRPPARARRRSRRALGLTLLLAATPSPAGVFEDHLFVLTSGERGGASALAGDCAAVDLLPPWKVSADLEAVGPHAIVRHFDGLHYVVNRSPDDNVQVIDPSTYDTIREFSTGAGSNPQDILVTGPRTAYVSRYDSRWLYKVDPSAGAVIDSLDLGPLADPDGIPEMSMMARDGDHLFVQIQRRDRGDAFHPVLPSYLAVIDIAADEVVDVDPAAPGIQGIALAGSVPALKMQIEPDRRRLYVSAPGDFLDHSGGIEEIDLDGLRSTGFVTSEAIVGPDITAFVLVSEEKGYLLAHTDFALSSHLTAFSRIDGSTMGEIFVTFSLVQNLAFDPETNQLFFPDNGEALGIRIFDATSDEMLSEAPIPTGLPPADVVVARQELVGVPSAPVAPVSWVVPNPMRSHVDIMVRSEKRCEVFVFSVGGRLVRRLLADSTDPEGGGTRSARWDGRDAAGRPLPDGVYGYLIPAAGVAEGRIVRVR